MNEYDLVKVSSFDNIRKTCWLRLHWSSEIYSYGRLLREYSNYPKFLPLAVKSDHSGPNFNTVYTDVELPYEVEYYLGHNHQKNLEHNSKFGFNKFVTVISPFVFFRRKYNINYNPNNIGTIAFPIHSDQNVNRSGYFNAYLDDLHKLDSQFQPITICLHQHDILNGNYKQFLDKGFNIVTVGNTHNEGFVERFYSLVSKYKYITSNLPSTITFLAIEMKAPFFFYGNSVVKPSLIPKDEFKLNPIYFQLLNLLSLNNDNKITQLPDEIVSKIENMLGVNDTISPRQLLFLLYKSLFFWLMKGYFILWFIKRIKIYLK